MTKWTRWARLLQVHSVIALILASSCPSDRYFTLVIGKHRKTASLIRMGHPLPKLEDTPRRIRGAHRARANNILICQCPPCSQVLAIPKREIQCK